MEFLCNFREAVVRLRLTYCEAFSFQDKCKKTGECLRAGNQVRTTTLFFPPESSIPVPAENLFLWEGRLFFFYFLKL